MSATVKITGLKEVQAQISKFANELPKKADAIVSKGVKQMVESAKQDAAEFTDQGLLMGGITEKKNGFADYSMISNASYSPYLEFGTKGNYQPIPGIDASEFKGKGGDGKGFFENILRWVKRKKIAGVYSTGIKRKKGGGFTDGGGKNRRVGKKADIEKENEQVAWAIYLSILKHGIKAHPFFFKQGDKYGPVIIKEIEQLTKQVKING
jgi:hypothetical protein